MRKEENLEKKKIDFFKAYDEIAKEPFPHEDFLECLKEKIVSVKSIEDVPRELCLGLYDFYSKPNKKEFENWDQDSFKDHFKNKRIEKVWLKLSAIKEKIEDDVGKKNIEFVQKLADFIFAFKEKYSLDFFKRFFFVYDYEKSSTKCEENKEWLENHEIYLRKLKNDEEFDDVREWYKEQLEKIIFDKLSEEHKSEFFRECFVAFACVSDDKKGHNGTWNKERKKIFLLGRLFNIHLLPLELIENKEKESNELFQKAFEIKRNMNNFFCPSKKDIEEASKKSNEKVKMCLSDDVGTEGKRKQRISVDYIAKSSAPFTLKTFGINLQKEKEKNIKVIESCISGLSQREFQDLAEECNGTKEISILSVQKFIESIFPEKKMIDLGEIKFSRKIKFPEFSLRIFFMSDKNELMPIGVADNFIIEYALKKLEQWLDLKNISSSPLFSTFFAIDAELDG